MSPLKQFTPPPPRPLPTIILADISGSMSVEGKIEALNRAIAEMISSLASETNTQAEVQVAVITFGGRDEAQVYLPLAPISQVQWTDVPASGRTPLGAALEVATDLVEDRSKIPGRAYYPTIVLVSDGQPTDEWKAPLERLLTSERGKKAVRLAMAIGEDADETVLKEFIANPDVPLFRAEQARQIKQFFQWVTMTVSALSKSINPQSVPLMMPDAIEDLEDLI